MTQKSEITELKIHSASALVKKVTGEALSSSYFTKYLEEKYSDIYKI